MKAWFAALGIALVLVAGFAASSAPESRAAAVRGLEFEVWRPDGQPVELHFLVRAPSDDEAWAAAVRAAEQLVPGGAIAPSAGRVSAAYAFWPWAWPAEMLPVPVAYNPAGAPAGIDPGAVPAGLAPWSAVPDSSFRIAFSGETSAVPGVQDGILDGQNTIGWVDMDCAGGCVLGVTTKLQSAFEVDIALNSNPEAALGDGSGETADVQSVVLHEAGHLAGLEHSCQPFIGSCTSGENTAVMFPRYQGIHRELEPDDVAGIAALYPANGEAGGGSPESTVEYSLDLDAGWNLVVLPPGPLDSTMAGLGCVDAVYSRQGAEWFVWLRDGARALNSLSTASGDAAYWLHSTAACNQTFTLTRFA
ncbi:MAG: matrixin family metalloprotease [Hyphomicrobiales bacterium]